MSLPGESQPSEAVLRVPVRPLSVGRVELDEPTSRYLLRVHRLRAGAKLVAFDPEAETEAVAELVSERLPCAAIEVAELGPTSARPWWRVTLLQGVGKADKPEQVARDATVLGASRLVFVHTERSVARAEGRTKRQREHRVAVEAARQSGRGNLPAIEGPLPLEDGMASLSAQAHKLVLGWHPQAVPLLTALGDWDTSSELVLLVGPEGGLTPQELELAFAAGFAPVGLGPFVLRTETAATVALGLAQGYAERERASDAPPGQSSRGIP